MMIYGLNILFFRKINNPIMKEFAILLLENKLKQLPEK